MPRTISQSRVLSALDRPGRDQTLDALKGFGIALVVLGHAIQRNFPGEYSRTAPFELIYAFHMAFLIFLSGWTLAGRIKPPLLGWIAGRALRLLVPFFVWYLVYKAVWRLWLTGFRPFLDYSGSIADFVWHGLVLPSTGLWFLWVLFWCSLILGLSKRAEPLLGRGYVGLAAAVALALPVVVVPYADTVGGDFGAAAVGWYFPAFAAGYVFSLSGERGARILRALEPLALLLFPVLVFSRPAIVWLKPETLGLSPIDLMLYKWITAAAGILSARAIVHLLVDMPACRIVVALLAYLGVISLDVYVLHLLVLRVGVGSGWIRVLTVFAFALGFSATASWLLRRAGLGVLFGQRPRLGGN